MFLLNLHRAIVVQEGRTLLLVFAVLFGLLAALIRGYGYGMSDQEVHIPEILRILDSGYLANDFSINSAANFGPRFYYSHTVASIARYIPLEATFATLFLLTYIATSCITALAAKDITGSTITGMVAVVLVMSLIPLHFGNNASVLWSTVVPSYLALPLSLFGIWKAITDKPVYTTCALVPAILIHPMVGLQGTTVALAAIAARRIFLMRSREGERGYMSRLFWPLSLAFAVISVETILFWVLPAYRTGAISSVEAREFIRIIAHFRHPGNLVPSSWSISNYILMGMFTFVVGTALIAFWRHKSSTEEPWEYRARQVAIGAILLIIVLAFFAGYFFVEIVPTRIVAQAYVFRLTPVFVWIGWILIAYSISYSLERGAWKSSYLLVASTLHPVTMFLYRLATLDVLRPRLHGVTQPQSVIVFVILLVLLIVGGTLLSLLLARPIRAVTALQVIPGLLAIAVIVGRPQFARLSLLSLGALLALTVTVFALDRLDVLPEIRLPVESPLPERFKNTSAVGYFQPVLTTEEAMASPRCRCSHVAELAKVARRETEPDAVFLVPSNWRNWRMFSERAVVVDGKFMPFRDEGMLEWHKRHIDVYDPDVGAGYPEDVTDLKLFELQDRYRFDYAVLPIGSGIELPILGQTEEWKLVRMKEL